ncbi:MAG: endo alpha-1,4 polygalactosaminidase [Actinomycetota bacterium]
MKPRTWSRRIAAVALLTLVLPLAPVRDALASGPHATRSLAKPVKCRGCWAPGIRISWQWQLQSPPKAADLLGVRMYDVDGFETSKKLVHAMHRQHTKAVCYLSAGTWENWRPDASEFPARVLGNKNGWPGERWVDIRALRVLAPIMKARLDMCAAKGFDGVEFDNVDGYQNKTGFPLTGAQQLRYDVFLANQAHRRGMAAFLKNDLGQVKTLLPYFDAALNEQCHQYKECAKLDPFVNAGKPVFGVEYKLATSAFCPDANARNFNFLKKRLVLGPWRKPCRGA